MAVLYRTNAQSRAIEESLVCWGIPYLVVGGLRFYDRREIKDPLAYLRLLVNPADTVSLLRVINAQTRHRKDHHSAAHRTRPTSWESWPGTWSGPRGCARRSLRQGLLQFCDLLNDMRQQVQDALLGTDSAGDGEKRLRQ